jgi:hypothetical protein
MMTLSAMKSAKLLAYGIFLLFASQISMGQVAKRKLVEIPTASCAVAVIQQPDSPLVIENARLYASEKGTEPFLFYDLRNRSNRAVRYYSIVTRVVTDLTGWFKFGNGGQADVGDPAGTGPNLIEVGGTTHEWPFRNFDVVPMNDTTRSFFSSNGTKPGFRGLWLIMVKEVVLDDGSRFKATDLASGIDDLTMRLPE